MKVKETVAVVEALMAAQGKGADRRLVEARRGVLAQIEAGELDPEADIDEVIEERHARIAEAEAEAMQRILDIAALSDLPDDVPVLRKLWDVDARAGRTPPCGRSCGPWAARWTRPTETETAGHLPMPRRP